MKEHNKKTRGIVVAGLGGGSGKSVAAVGLTAALARMGHSVVAFKKGPDYIDSGWLSLAAGRPCYNLDQYLMTPESLKLSFVSHASASEMVIIEGNRGLYDGVDAAGSFSTAELALSLELPVLLVVDCTKTTRTVAAMVLGCRELDKRVRICGVILNRVGTARHEKIVREAVENYTGIPVLGAFRRSRQDVFPQRHLGVTPGPEHADAGQAVETLAQWAAERLDIQRIRDAMEEISIPVDSPGTGKSATAVEITGGVRIGVIRDAAFQFYYQENLDALEALGANLVMINALTATELPDVDALYIGGGFPETSVKALSANVSFRNSIKKKAEEGLPVYAECGGLIFLGESLDFEGIEYPLVGVFPAKFGLKKKPQAHGYTVLEATRDNPFYRRDTVIKGHEFRYSFIAEWHGDSGELIFEVKRGVGFIDGRDGLVFANVLALYTHVHAVGTPLWAEGLVKQAVKFRERIK